MKKPDKIYNLWKVENWLWRKHLTPLALLIRAFIRVVFSADIPYKLKVGEGTRFPHDALGSLIHQDAVIGRECRILHGITVGGKGGSGLPIIKDKVWIGPHSILLGDIVIGEGSIVGAGSVVVKDVPPYSVVAGNPAKVIKQLTPPLLSCNIFINRHICA